MAPTTTVPGWRRPRFVLAAAAGLGLLAACGGSGGGSGAAAPNTVTIKNYSFTPSTITVSPGTTVSWQDKDSVPHTVTDADGSAKALQSPTLNKGATYRYTFKTPGTYSYVCTIHPYMKGNVVVR